MPTYSTNEFKPGMKVMLDSSPCNIIENEYVKPGKGQAFNRVKLRNLKTGRVLEKTFKSGETLEAADVVETAMQYLYHDGQVWHFMNVESYEQMELNDESVGDAKFWLKEQDPCMMVLFEGNPLQVVPENFVNLKVVETDPGLKGDTSGGGSKTAILETGASIRVPLFLKIDELVKVDTRTGEYVSRVKEV